MQRTGPIRVLLVERRPLLPGEVRNALLHDSRFQLLGQVATAAEATRLSRTESPDLVVCDTSIADPGAVELVRFYRLRMPGTVAVFISSRIVEDELFEAARVGVAAYLPISLDARSFLAALARAARGEYLIDEEVVRHPSVASRVLAQFRQRPTNDLPFSRPVASDSSSSSKLAPLFVPLSAREIEILDLVARGNSNKLIARHLGISDQTVKNHVTTILRKLEVNDRTEAVVYALRNGWIRIDAPTAGR